MHQLSAFAFLATLLLPSSSAQNNSNTICSDLELNLRYNASTTRQIPALRINGTRPLNNYVDEGYYSVENDTSRTWSLTYRINNMSTQTGNSLYTQDTLLLDTGVSNMTNMGSCHQTMAPGNSSGNFQWTKEVLQRSLKDTGDCRATLGDGCVDALKEWYTEQAASNHMRRGNCGETNTTLPEACHGVLEPRSDIMNFTRYITNQRANNSTFNTLPDPSLECNGVNVSSTHLLTLNSGMDYSVAVRFPLVDIITFWPNRTNMQVYNTAWVQDVHVEIVCMRPGQIVQGSVVPPMGEQLLSGPNREFLPTGGAHSMNYAMLGWISVCALGIMLSL